MTGTINALIIGGLGILCALAAWQQSRLERAFDWAQDWLLAVGRWVVEVVRWLRVRPVNVRAERLEKATAYLRSQTATEGD